jgi:glycogen debranching enzyme
LPWSDYQLRPNFLIALAVAPQMFNKDHAKLSLQSARQHLLNDPHTIGIKTLDESDFNYCGYYDNSNNTSDGRVANGFNYHNGPEWLWPVGFYLRAELIYNGQSSLQVVKERLARFSETLSQSDWKSLPELTNKNGEACHYSCPSQAWSVATTLEVFHDLARI